jgi:hypothetical protein
MNRRRPERQGIRRGTALALVILGILTAGNSPAETLRFGTAEADRNAGYIDMRDEKIGDWEAFYGFLSEVYQTYTNKIAHTEDILAILRSHNDSKEMNDLIAFYFKEN